MTYIDGLTICTTILGFFWSLKEVFKTNMFKISVLTIVSWGLLGMYVFYGAYIGYSMYSEFICNLYNPIIKSMRLVFTIIAIPWSGSMYYHFKKTTNEINNFIKQIYTP
jgi:hypothetical protein